jgi:hypothetical protein
LIDNKFIEIGIGEHFARAPLAVTDGDIFERTGRDVGIEGFDRAAELGSGLGGGLEPVRWGMARRGNLSVLADAEQGFNRPVCLDCLVETVASLMQNEDAARRLAR